MPPDFLCLVQQKKGCGCASSSSELGTSSASPSSSSSDAASSPRASSTGSSSISASATSSPSTSTSPSTSIGSAADAGGAEPEGAGAPPAPGERSSTARASRSRLFSCFHPFFLHTSSPPSRRASSWPMRNARRSPPLGCEDKLSTPLRSFWYFAKMSSAVSFVGGGGGGGAALSRPLPPPLPPAPRPPRAARRLGFASDMSQSIMVVHGPN
mmetsp:Transcript_17390/g.51626  ORF Transcript_17390/g.51626 Transcript_17390/m.51626 type:complete len:212 (+) Transcript_17390:390-1025(+)